MRHGCKPDLVSGRLVCKFQCKDVSLASSAVAKAAAYFALLRAVIFCFFLLCRAILTLSRLELRFSMTSRCSASLLRASISFIERDLAVWILVSIEIVLLTLLRFDYDPGRQMLHLACTRCFIDLLTSWPAPWIISQFSVQQRIRTFDKVDLDFRSVNRRKRWKRVTTGMPNCESQPS